MILLNSLLECNDETHQEEKMKITKRQLKRIIREEYSRLKRRGLLREMRGGGHYDSIMSANPEFELDPGELQSKMAQAPMKARKLASDPRIQAAEGMLAQHELGGRLMPLLDQLLETGIVTGDDQMTEALCEILGEAGLSTTVYNYSYYDPYGPFISGHNIVWIKLSGNQALVMVDDYRGPR